MLIAQRELWTTTKKQQKPSTAQKLRLHNKYIKVHKKYRKHFICITPTPQSRATWCQEGSPQRMFTPWRKREHKNPSKPHHCDSLQSAAEVSHSLHQPDSSWWSYPESSHCFLSLGLELSMWANLLPGVPVTAVPCSPGLGSRNTLSSMKPELPLPWALPPASQVMALTCHYPAILLLLWALLPGSWHVALIGHHCGHDASVVRLPPRVRVGTLTHHPHAVWILLPAPPQVQVTGAPCHPRAHAAVASTPAGISDPQRLRPWFYWWSAHAYTLDTSASAAASTPVLQDQGAVLILCVPDPRPLALLLVQVTAHQTRCQEESPWLELPPMGKKRRTGRSQQHLWRSQ